MEELHLPDNINVHFASCEVQNQYLAVEALGVRYGLYTCFPFVERSALGEENPPLGIALVMKGEHLCKTMRGAKKKGLMTTSRLTGIFREGAARNEFMSLIH